MGFTPDERLLAPLDAEVGGHVAKALCQGLPDFVAELFAAVVDDRLAHALAKLVRRHLGSRHADDPVVVGQ